MESGSGCCIVDGGGPTACDAFESQPFSKTLLPPGAMIGNAHPAAEKIKKRRRSVCLSRHPLGHSEIEVTHYRPQSLSDSGTELLAKQTDRLRHERVEERSCL